MDKLTQKQTTEMKLEEAYSILKQMQYIPFGKLFTQKELAYINKNKGQTGQLLELALGLSSSNANLDFADGELKTNKCDTNGKPKETIFITQICKCIDDLFLKKHFQEMNLYEKIRNILYVPVMKEGNPKDWMFLPSVHIELEKPAYIGIRKQLEDDYYNICQQLEDQVLTSQNGWIGTANGTYLQIRCKDFKGENGNYNPIYSELYGRYISNKNHAFYFKKQFIQAIRACNEEL